MENNHDSKHSSQFPWEKNGGSVGYWLKRAYFGMRRNAESKLRPYGVTHSQWQVLGLLFHKDGMTQSELERIIRIEAPSLTNLIDGMVKKGWVQRRQHKVDARVKQVFLKEKGKQVFDKVPHVASIGEDRMLNGLTKDEIGELKKSLRKIAENLE